MFFIKPVFIQCVSVAALLVSVAGPTHTQDVRGAKENPDPVATWQSVAVGGYDTTSYFQEGLPKKGNPEISHFYLGQYYYFSSEENKEIFISDPARYSPLYAGHCAHSFALNVELKGNPEIFNFDSDGNLLLFATDDAKDQWLQDTTGFKQKADKRWEERKGDLTKYKVKF